MDISEVSLGSLEPNHISVSSMNYSELPTVYKLCLMCTVQYHGTVDGSTPLVRSGERKAFVRQTVSVRRLESFFPNRRLKVSA